MAPDRAIDHAVTVPNDLLPLVTQYRAGLEAEIALLERLAALAERQREVTASGSLAALTEITDARDGIMANLVAVEAQLAPIRRLLVMSRERLAHEEEFEYVTALHKKASTLASDIMSADQHSMESLREAELARRFAQESLDQGESTLAAYRRVVNPPLANATLVNRRG
ncbi:MAG TPA: hypothetical protein VGD94_02640 [Vicinamibacterales bacterium]